MSETYTVHIYKDKAKEWRWHVLEANGKIVATSAESYVKKSHAVSMVEKLFHALPVVSADD